MPQTTRELDARLAFDRARRQGGRAFTDDDLEVARLHACRAAERMREAHGYDPETQATSRASAAVIAYVTAALYGRDPESDPEFRTTERAWARSAAVEQRKGEISVAKKE